MLLTHSLSGGIRIVAKRIRRRPSVTPKALEVSSFVGLLFCLASVHVCLLLLRALRDWVIAARFASTHGATVSNPHQQIKNASASASRKPAWWQVFGSADALGTRRTEGAISIVS